jgi:hypothetical protein
MTPTSSLAGKRVLVTGGSRGIGAAIVRRLASQGATVAVNYRSDRAAADALVGELRDNGCAASAFPADVSDVAQTHELVGAVVSEFGGLDLLVSPLLLPESPPADLWEPFVTLDSSGHLALFFSDERQNATYSQFVGEIISTDGGNTWTANPDGSTNFGPGEIKVVASPFPADRAGMATVAQLGPGGDYVLSYEMCGPQNCAVHVKTSADGDNWGSGPSDLGTVPQTSDGLFLQGTPVITWVETGGVDGSLFLTGRYEASTSGTVPQNQNLILTNANSTTGPSGPWSWIPTPAIPTAGANPTVCGTPNYSPDLMESVNNTALLYTTAAVTGSHGCEEITDTIPIG